MAAKQNLLGALAAQSKPAAAGGFVYGGASQGGALFGAASAAQGASTFSSGLGAGSLG